jgi:hypothetical protein
MGIDTIPTEHEEILQPETVEIGFDFLKEKAKLFERRDARLKQADQALLELARLGLGSPEQALVKAQKKKELEEKGEKQELLQLEEFALALNDKRNEIESEFSNAIHELIKRQDQENRKILKRILEI